VTKAIAAGGSNREVAARFDLKISSVQRHRTNCLAAPRREKSSGDNREPNASAGSVRFDSTEGEISSPRDLLGRLSKLFRLGDLLEEAYERRDVDAVVKLAREYRAAAESYAKVAGWLVEGGSNSTIIDARRQSIALLGKLTTDELRSLAAGETIATLESAPATLEYAHDNQALSSGIGTALRDAESDAGA
jgi:hypothetical protein